LAPSTKTRLTFDGAGDFEAGSYSGRNLHYGVREHAMGAVLNGLSLSKLRAYGSGFLIFSDYGRNPIRLAAIMEIPVIYVFTHDSIGVGEDGPTHEPIEHLMALRAVPHMTDFRPADANETAATWRLALERKKPCFFALTRQNVPVIDPATHDAYAGVSKGAYVLEDVENPQVVLIATGSEVGPSLDAAKLLAGEGVRARVVSFPSWRIFEEQPASYKSSVLPKGVPKLAVEAGATLGWWKYVGSDGDVVGIDRFGASAPGGTVMAELGFTPENIAARAKKLIEQRR
ncbi:MAG: transketolase-like TK C-terminal-containing protein, partial [Terracidiphilus sp.]